MTRKEYNDLFTQSIEKERHRLGFTQEQMAKELGLSLSVYKRMISGQVEKIDSYIIYKGYLLTQKFAFEMIGYSDLYCNIVSELKHCNEEELNHIYELVKILKKARENNHEC